MKAGKLRHRLVIERPENIRDPLSGGYEKAWVIHKAVWAAFEPLSVRDLLAAQANQSQITARITLRYRDDIDSTMRTQFRDKYYYFEGVLADSKSGLEYLTIPVREGLADG